MLFVIKLTKNQKFIILEEIYMYGNGAGNISFASRVFLELVARANVKIITSTAQINARKNYVAIKSS